MILVPTSAPSGESRERKGLKIAKKGELVEKGWLEWDRIGSNNIPLRGNNTARIFLHKCCIDVI